MTNEQINIAIAESCGWTFINQVDKRPHGLPPDGKKDRYTSPLPYYCNDLNAMHEAIETISVGEKSTYIIHLMDICREHPIGCVPDWTRDKQSLARLVQATARQRAEAFLKTLGKWEEEA